MRRASARFRTEGGLFVKIYFSFLSTLLTFSALAATNPAEYRRFSSVPKAQRLQYKIQSEATTPIHFDIGSNCSGVYVNNHGALLTSLHCVEECIGAASLKTQTLIDVEAIEGTIMNKVRPRPEVIGLRCAVRFGPKLKPGSAEILALFGPGWISPRSELDRWMNSQPDNFRKVLHEGFEGSGDMVLLRLRDEQNNAVASLCADVAQNRPPSALARETGVINLAYPLLARKTENPFEPLLTLGSTLMWSQAEATRDLQDLKLVGQFADLDHLVEFFLAPGTIASSVDSEPGASGSPLFNVDGELVGLIRATWKGDTGYYFPWRSQAVDLVPLRERLLQILGGQSCVAMP